MPFRRLRIRYAYIASRYRSNNIFVMEISSGTRTFFFPSSSVVSDGIVSVEQSASSGSADSFMIIPLSVASAMSFASAASWNSLSSSIFNCNLLPRHNCPLPQASALSLRGWQGKDAFAQPEPFVSLPDGCASDILDNVHGYLLRILHALLSNPLNYHARPKGNVRPTCAVAV